MLPWVHLETREGGGWGNSETIIPHFIFFFFFCWIMHRLRILMCEDWQVTPQDTHRSHGLTRRLTYSLKPQGGQWRITKACLAQGAKAYHLAPSGWVDTPLTAQCTQRICTVPTSTFSLGLVYINLLIWCRIWYISNTDMMLYCNNTVPYINMVYDVIYPILIWCYTIIIRHHISIWYTMFYIFTVYDSIYP